MMDSTSTKDLVEEREKPMVGKNPCFNSIDGSEALLPRQIRPASSSPDLKALSLSVSFHGWRFAKTNFKFWARKLSDLHEPTWRKAGIFEAIMASTYRIYKNTDLLLGVAEKWCPDTKTFVFPWGETTITLEDVMMLLGFSVLGLPVFATLGSPEMKKIQRNLEKEWLKMKKDGTNFVSQVAWTSRFMNSGDELEHVAFLVLWLSYFVFPSCYYHISADIFPVAVHLSSGTRIAIAPAVLAHLYSDLTLLKNHIRAFTETRITNNIDLTSLFKLVQVWTWERFRNLRPEAKEIPKGEARISRWSCLKHKYENVRLNFDDFDWRPYTKTLNNWKPLRFYAEEAMWITIDNSLNDKFVSFARCMRSSQLVGIGYIEDYYPNRVAKQFGSVQDLPGLVNRNLTEKEAWDDYNSSIDGLKLYMPSRLAQGSVTERYQDWCLKSFSEEMQKESAETFNARNTCDDVDVSPKVLPLSQIFQKLEQGFPAKLRRSRARRLAKNLRSEIEKDKRGELVKSLVPTGWRMNRTSEHLRNKTVHMKRAPEEEEDDNMTIAETIRTRKKYSDVEKTGGDASEPFGKRARSNDSVPCQKLASIKAEQMSEGDDEIASKAQKTMQICDDKVDVNGSNAEKKSMVDDETSNEKKCSEAEEKDVDERLKQRKLAIQEISLKLEARIMKVEKTLAKIRNWKTTRNHIQTGVSA